MYLGIRLRKLKCPNSIAFTKNSIVKLAIHFVEFPIVASVVIIAVLPVFAVLALNRRINDTIHEHEFVWRESHCS